MSDHQIRLILRDGEDQYRQAIMSPCGRYRYWLSRIWRNTGELTVFCMLNPSTADARLDDPTIRRVAAFAHAWGSRGLIVVNLYGARATEPDDLLEMDDPVGPSNDGFIGIACQQTNAIICAWGQHKTAWRRSKRVLELLRNNQVKPMALRVTRQGAPEHPLYIPADTVPKSYCIGGKNG